MPERIFIRCPVCTSFRKADVLGSEDQAAALMIQTIGGKAGIRWDRQPLPFAEAVALRNRMQTTLALLETEIAAAEAAGAASD